eukprot:TRINITY_DN4184_c0_g2_i3.p1 TRINITY_DN4184_c0_g2~~TRINITY_DN4184_c0_g2_i3.p1  ORF type:complete len:303 (-),score=25.13 TRINITY_DN4184_c0_g2_i3:29-937(-)
MLARRLKVPLLLSRSLSSHSTAHGLQKEVVKADATYVQTTSEGLKESLPTKIVFHERLVHWVSKFFPSVDIAYFVRNDRESKLSLYYWLGKFGLYGVFYNYSLHKPWFVRFCAKCLSNTMPMGRTKWDSLVSVHENSEFVYRSPQGQMVQHTMRMDYIPLLALTLTLLPNPWFALLLALPCGLHAVQWLVTSSRTGTCHTRCTWCSELTCCRTGRSCSSLSRAASADSSPSASTLEICRRQRRRIWTRCVFAEHNKLAQKVLNFARKYEKELVYTDAKTGRKFIFIKGGVWSEEGVSHKLLN